MAATTTFGRFVLMFHKVEFHNIETYRKLTTERKPNRPLITVSNHQATLDDPLLFSALTSQVGVKQSKNQRWTVGAAELCFGGMIVGAYCQLCKVLPVVRGIGIWQPMMDDAVNVLQRKGFDNWVHIFPEGRVHQVRGELLRFKWGVGRLVADPDTTPIVLPIFIEGTKHIIDEKRKTKWLPSSFGGERIVIRVGEPIDFTDLVNEAKEQALLEDPVDRVKTYKKITEIIQSKMEDLRVQTEL